MILLHHSWIISPLIFVLIFPVIFVPAVNLDWSSAITVKDYRWKAVKSELRNLNTEEKYRSNTFLGGINIRGGITSVSLRSTPPIDFDFFNGSRLDLFVVVEGDMVITLPKYNSDYHLCLLPTILNNVSFFEVLFEEKRLLENLTSSIYVNSSFSDSIAIVSMKYNDILDIQYEWDTATGILLRKEVTSPSGHRLLVIPTDDVTISHASFLPALISLSLFTKWLTFRKKKIDSIME